jgi:hypothetical protein
MKRQFSCELARAFADGSIASTLLDAANTPYVHVFTTVLLSKIARSFGDLVVRKRYPMIRSWEKRSAPLCIREERKYLSIAAVQTTCMPFLLGRP